MKITIITITYNSEKYLANTINSVLSQDLNWHEYLIIDGGSSDKSIDIIKDYAKRDTRIKWISEPDKGISDAMNKGINAATGDIISFLHSDDFYADSHVLSTVINEFERIPEALWITGGVYFVDENGRFLKEIRVRNYSYKKLVRGNCILHPATFVKRETFERVGGFDTSLRYAMDYDLWLRIGALADPFKIDKFLACFRIHREGLSSSNVQEAFAEELKIRKVFMRNRPGRFFFHYFYYLLKRIYCRHFAKSLLEY